MESGKAAEAWRSLNPGAGLGRAQVLPGLVLEADPRAGRRR